MTTKPTILTIKMPAQLHALWQVKAMRNGRTLQKEVLLYLANGVNYTLPPSPRELAILQKAGLPDTKTSSTSVEEDDNELGSPYKGPNAIPRPPKVPVKLADIAAEWEED